MRVYHLGRTPLILHPSHPSSSLMLLSLWAHPLLLEWLFSARWQMLLRAEKRGLLRVLGVNQPGPHGRGHGEVLKKTKNATSSWFNIPTSEDTDQGNGSTSTVSKRQLQPCLVLTTAEIRHPPGGPTAGEETKRTGDIQGWNTV